jgi:hypothetical protein
VARMEVVVLIVRMGRPPAPVVHPGTEQPSAVRGTGAWGQGIGRV